MPRIRRIGQSHRGNRTQRLRQNINAEDYCDEIGRLRNAQQKARSLEEIENGYPGDDFLNDRYDMIDCDEDLHEDQDPIASPPWQGYVAGSPVRPQTAFSLPLLIFHNHLWNNCHVGMMPFTLALTEWLEPRSQRLCAKNQDHARDVRKPFSAAVDIFRQLEEMSNELYYSVMQLDSQQILASASCPACFGPQPDESHKYPDATRNRLIVCLDGNFQHRHHAKASRDEVELKTPRIFVPPSDLEETFNQINAHEVAEEMDRCTESHKAANDKRNQSTWKGCDDTGLMGCCCRHDAAISMLNIHKSGEQRALPLTLVDKLLKSIEPERPRNLLPQDRGRLSFGTSVFHAYVHNWTCQLEYNPRFNTGWGLSDGEGLERGLSGYFKIAVKRSLDTSAILSELLLLKNPFSSSGKNYTEAYFKKQWKLQRDFKSQQSASDEDEKRELIALYKKEASLQELRSCLISPEIYLSTNSEIRLLKANIERMSEEVALQCVRLGTDLPTVDSEEQKLRLLLWDSKSELYVQAVHLHAERHPIVDAQRRGARLGTDLKEKIFKAIKSRKPAITKQLNVFNQHYQDYKERYPTQQLCIVEPFPLTYETFSAMPLDHTFWNDGLYYHSQAPWATNADVRTGINCVLILSRIQEEFELLAQELARGVGWAIDLYNSLSNCIGEIQSGLDRLGNSSLHVSPNENNNYKNDSSNMQQDNNSGNSALHCIVSLPLTNLSNKNKLQVVQKELQQRLLQHAIMVEDWSSDVVWLWSRCQPSNNGSNGLMMRWLELNTTVVSNKQKLPSSLDVIDDGLEEVILGVEFDDGEEVNDGWIQEDDAFEEPGPGDDLNTT
ncbi:hypothetical protein PCANC_16245 [Puccinia coronata f. sp. avenae]|uniref:CxC1-like cysteine cluster associated with KDZ transposases domain-containing protein n=1 Tax=Puccinia coronata f. sp. avenae TaxID=200324 RepID=A0A2N5SVF0_9BASI|nr:hypothetical protein PCANC_16245 [Puccinia coronata f. sp. avenae]